MSSRECSVPGGVAVYRFVLESMKGQSFLNYVAVVNQLRVLHWSGTLQLLAERGASRQDVLRAAQNPHWLSEDSRSEMALEWIVVERREPGRIMRELSQASAELESLRRSGRELAFARLKRDVLQLAASQFQSDTA